MNPSSPPTSSSSPPTPSSSPPAPSPNPQTLRCLIITQPTEHTPLRVILQFPDLLIGPDTIDLDVIGQNGTTMYKATGGAMWHPSEPGSGSRSGGGFTQGDRMAAGLIDDLFNWVAMDWLSTWQAVVWFWGPLGVVLLGVLLVRKYLGWF